MAPTGSSILSLSSCITDITTIIPAIKPTMTEYIGLIKSAPAVIPTKPANEPFNIMDRSGFFEIIVDVIMAPITPAAAASVVVTNTRETPPGSAERTEPPLNPYHPNHSKNTPIVAYGKLCPRFGLIFPFFEYFPKRGPSVYAPTRAAQPPTLCTNVEPAKSCKPIALNHPPPHCHDPATG